MNQDSNSTTTHRGRMILLLIAGLPVAMILAATWLWFYVVNGDINLAAALGTANRGELVEPPRSMQELGVPAANPAATVWTLLVPGREGCGKACLERLHYTRQIRTAMGKYTNRIQRVLIGFDKAELAALERDLRAEHPKLDFLYTYQAQWQTLMGEVEQAEAGSAGELPDYYLVDPQGWIMMSYAADTDGKDVMADLKFLMKNSNG